MTTIHDVAARAGVASKTVSRVLNKHPNVSDQMRQRVEQAMADLAFAPSQIARQMRSGKYKSIGVLYSDPSSAYQSRLNHALLKACAAANRYMVVELFDEAKPDWAAQVLRFVDRADPAALVLVPPLCDSLEVHALLTARGIATVLISPSTPVAGLNSISMNDLGAARDMTERLLALGHRRLAHISGRETHVAAKRRRQGFEEAIRNNAVTHTLVSYVREGQFNFKLALDQTRDLLGRSDRPTAIFAANDHMALASIMMARQLGHRVPEDLSVAGFDDAWNGESLWPPLTSVAQPYDRIAELAVSLLSRPTGKDAVTARDHVLPLTFVPGGTIAPAGERI